MKKIIFIHGPNGVGKSTLCKILNQRIINSAWLESEWCRMTNPFVFDDEIIAMTISNMTYMLRSYLTCSSIEYVIYNYGFHGPRKQIYDKVVENISDLEYKLIPITITCSESENVNRMIKDGRDNDRIKRALVSRSIYNGLGNPRIDTTNLPVNETVDKVMEIIKNYK